MHWFETAYSCAITSKSESASTVVMRSESLSPLEAPLDICRSTDTCIELSQHSKCRKEAYCLLKLLQVDERKLAGRIHTEAFHVQHHARVQPPGIRWRFQVPKQPVPLTELLHPLCALRGVSTPDTVDICTIVV